MLQMCSIGRYFFFSLITGIYLPCIMIKALIKCQVIWLPGVIKCCARLSGVIICFTRLSGVIKCFTRLSGVIKYFTRLSSVIKCCAWSLGLTKLVVLPKFRVTYIWSVYRQNLFSSIRYQI